MQFLTAPVAIVLDAIAFAVSALCIGLISHHRARLGPPDQSQKRQNVLRNIGDGLHLVRTQPLLRASAGTAGTYNLFNTAFQSLYVLFLTRDLGIVPPSLGTLLALAGPGSLLGALLAVKTGHRFGLGPTMIGGIAIAGVSKLFIPATYLIRGDLLFRLGLLALASFLNGFGQPFYTINQVSLRQAITPDHIRGRVNATMPFVAGRTGPIGALVGGILGQLFGLPLVVTLAALGTLFALTWLLFSGIWFLSELPQHSCSDGSK